MRLFVLQFVFFILSAGFIGAIQSEDLNAEIDAGVGKHTSTPSTTTTAITTASTTVSTTTEPTTISTITTTLSPNTTVAPTTIPTTVAPTTIPTTVAPKPNPPSTLGTWNVTDPDTNITCIIVQLSAQFLVSYITNDNKIRNTTLSLPNNAYSTGHCNGLDAVNQTITLHWVEDIVEQNATNKLVLTFQKNQTKLHQSVEDNIGQDRYVLSGVRLSLYRDAAHFPNASKERIEVDANNVNLYSTNLNNSQICNANQSILLTSTAKNDTAIVYLNKVHIEAFRTKPNATFSNAEYCSADGTFTSDVVPIAVGCALAALVVIVLIAYLVGRRRARQRGYQSV